MIFSDFKILGIYSIYRPVQVDDASFIVHARNQIPRSDFLSPTTDSIPAQEAWLRDYQRRNFQKTEYYFIVEDTFGIPQGTTRIYKIDENVCTVGSWVLVQGAPFPISLESYLAPLFFAFEHLGLKKVDIDVRKANTRVWKWHELCGAQFVEENEFERFYYYDLPGYKKAKKRVDNLLSTL